MNERTSLEEVLNGYGYEAGEKDPRSVLDKYLREYPQFSAELMEFAASGSFLKYAPEAELTAEEELHYRQFGVQQLRAFLKKSLPPFPA